MNAGFDTYYGVLHSNDMLPLELYSQETMIEDPVIQETLTQRYTEQALAFVEDSVVNDDPFFLYLPHSFPHVPLYTTAPFEGQSDAGLYGDVVETIDWSMGEIKQTNKRGECWSFQMQSARGKTLRPPRLL